MRKDAKNPGGELFLPSETDLPKLSVSDLHSLWRTNEPTLIQLATDLNPDHIPFLAVHGSSAERIKQLSKGDSPAMWVFAAYERIRNTRELIRNLYCLSSAASGYSFCANEGRGPIKGEAGMMCFGVENSRQFYDWKGELRDAWKHGNISSFFPQTMPHTFRLPQTAEQPDAYGYVSESLDNATECDFFNFRKDPPKIIASDTFTPEKEGLRIAIFDGDTPKYLFRSQDPEPCLNSYRQQILRRLFCQNLSATLIGKLRGESRMAYLKQKSK